MDDLLLKDVITIGPLAVRLGLLDAHLRKLCNREKIPFLIFHGMRVFRESDVPAIRAACIEAGYLKPAGEVPANGS